VTVTAIEATNDGVTLAGSLWRPTDAVSALVAMQPGSGPSDRDNDVLFPPIRRALLEHGLAVCSFDKRGVGESAGSWLEADVATQAADLAASVAAASALLPSVPIGLFGHSQGGWVVLEACELVAPDFVITNSGPGVSPRVQEQFSTKNRIAGVSPQRRTAAVELFDSILDRLSRGDAFDAVDGWLREPHQADVAATLVDAGAFVPQEEALWRFATTLIDYDPQQALRKVRVPLLALFGAADTVVPVEASVNRFRANVRAECLDVRVFPGADHRIQVQDGDDFAAGYLDAITGFIARLLPPPFPHPLAPPSPHPLAPPLP
jgi:pimeloyl-ACP methyl ester carboxylesterase